MHITRDEVLKEIKNLDPSKTTKESNISYENYERKCWIIDITFLLILLMNAFRVEIFLLALKKLI